MASYRYYSIRRLSPFQGTLQVIKTENGRALSSDGLNWHVQARCEVRQPKWGRLQADIMTRRYASFGLWSLKAGLERVPVNPCFDLQCLRAGAEEVVGALAAKAQTVPFPRLDHRELWLLDRERRRPMALIASALPQSPLPRFRKVEWLPWSSRSMSVSAVPLRPQAENSSVTDESGPPRDTLVGLVHRACGVSPSAQWFQRSPEGQGQGLEGIRLEPELEGRTLESDAFPELPLREIWDDPDEQHIVRRYHDWQAPFLLTLGELTPSTRDRLERAACRQALAIHSLHRLYPKILNPEMIKSALVEAVIRKTTDDSTRHWRC